MWAWLYAVARTDVVVLLFKKKGMVAGREVGPKRIWKSAYPTGSGKNQEY